MKANDFKSEHELLDEILAELKALNLKLKQRKEPVTDEVLLDSADVLHLLKITARTAERWRKTGKLKSLKIGGKIYYRKKDVEELVKALG